MLTIKNAIKKIKTAYPHGVDLCYVDYRDNFSEYHKEMEELAQTGFIDSLEMEWTGDQEWETIHNYLIPETFTEPEQKEIKENEELKQAIQDAFFEMNTSTPITDMLDNTGRRFFFYDLNFTLENCDGMQDAEKQAREIAKFLRISYAKYAKQLYELTANVGYGGNLCILFTCEPKAFFGDIDEKYIHFKNRFNLCIMDRDSGSGHDIELIDEKTKKFIPFTFEFKRENLHDDRGFSGYSYSYDVCGLCMFDEAYFNFIKKPLKSAKILEVSTNFEIQAFEEQQKKYNDAYKAGKCTLGDMKMSRHRETEYINNFPCGHKCKSCGNFWID